MDRPSLSAERWFTPLALVLVVGCFLALTYESLSLYFTHDDLMNLYRSWVFPLPSLIRANLIFWKNSEFYRPAGSAWYRAVFDCAGLNPRPFHAIVLLILAANIALTYSAARRISASREAGLLSALLIAYHPAFAHLYFDTGFVYDVLCYFFYFSAFAFYLRMRQAGNPAGPWRVAWFLVLYVCALNSKEMAVTLPLALLLYEALYHGKRITARWLLAEGAAFAASALITIVFVLGRVSDAQALARANHAYAMVFDWHRFMETSRMFLRQLFLSRQDLSTPQVILVWMGLLAVARMSRLRTLLFAWFFLMLGVVPVAFLSPRGAPQYYVPFFGWVLFASAGLDRGTRWLLRRASEPIRAARAPALFATTLLLVYPYYHAIGWSNVTSARDEAPGNQFLVAQLRALVPSMRRGARVFFFDDPFPPDWENLIFVVHLTYADTTIEIHRLKRLPGRPTDLQLAAYDHVFDYRAGRLLELHCPWRLETLPTVFMTLHGPDIRHQDWSPVSVDNPARPGEFLIARATNLGDTTPPVAPGSRFPKSPLLPLAAKLTVKVEGHSARTQNELGWPEEVNVYRFDFQVPTLTHAGAARVDWSAGATVCLPFRIPVRR